MASSYVNNLRLNEMATGDASGTWGTITNTNLELIGEALGFGTEAITTNADTHTTTVADGASDGGRAMYLKYTGTLDSTCTITIAPNTLNRLHFIENGTSGSQNIIISQGSGANITIPAGDTKAVYLDGAGSGAAVVDAFASLSVVDLKVQDDLTVNDDLLLNSDSAVLSIGADADLKITHDGSNGDFESAGNLTFDVAGNIDLDADGGQVSISDGGTEIGYLFNSSSDFNIQSAVSDKDIKFNGNDGGSTITALTLDMSLAGKADFNAGASFADNVILGTGANLFLNDNGKLNLGNSSDLQIYFDATNSHIDTAGNLTLDVAGNINLDADGGNINLQDGSVGSFGYLSNSSSDFVIQSGVDDKDIIFKGSDGGSTITALTLDMSSAGDAFFNSRIYVPVSIVHTGDSNTSIDFDTDIIDLYTGGGLGLRVSNSTVTVNEGGADKDFRVETPGNTHTFFIEGGTNRVGIGTSSPSHKLTVQSDSDTDFDPSNANFNVAATLKNTTSGASNCVSLALVTETNGEVYLSSVQNSGNDTANMAFSTRASGTRAERMRVTKEGLLINTDATLHSGVERSLEVLNHSGNGFAAIFKGVATASHETVCIHNGATSGTRILLTFKTSGSTGTLVGRITSDGSTTNYATSSDYRLKENLEYNWDATTRLKQLKPARFNWIADESNTAVDGFIAHEVSSIVPAAVSGEKDAMAVETRYTEDDVETQGDNPSKSVGDTKTYSSTEIDPQSIDHSKLVPLLVKTIQELEARITALEGA